MSTKRMIAATGWRFHKTGAPSKVLQLEKYRVPFDRQGKDVVVKMLAAPVHKHDKNLIEGHYGPIKRTGYPAVAGVEGVGVVEEVGSAVQLGVQPGDIVWINNQNVGTWATHVVTDADNVDVLPNRADIDIEYLASLSVFHTAHHLVNDFVKLQPGDVVLQTGAASSVAQVTASFAKARGLKMFQTLMPGRTNHSSLVESFKSHGAFAVVPPSYARSSYMRRLLSDVPEPKLLLNHAGGSDASSLVKLLCDKGTCVTYGNCSGRPMQIAAVDALARGISFKHFFLPTWIAEHSREARMRVHQNTLEALSQAQGHCAFLAERFKMDCDSAFAFAQAWDAPHSSRKPVLRMVGEYGEWRRPDNVEEMLQVGLALWDDLLQESKESSAMTDQPHSMKYYTPFGDMHSDLHNAAESRQMGYREVFFRRPNAPRHNTDEAGKQ